MSGVSTARSLKRSATSKSRDAQELATFELTSASNAPTDEEINEVDALGAATSVAEMENEAALAAALLKATNAYSADSATPPMQTLVPLMPVST